MPRSIYRFHSSTMVFAMALLAGISFSAGALTVSLGTGGALSGETAEVGVTLDVSGTGPSSLLLVYTYNPEKLRPGAAFYENGAVRPESGALSAGKHIQSAVHEEGVLAIAVLGGTASMPSGKLCTIGFEVLDAAEENELIPVTPVAWDVPVTVAVAEGAGQTAIASSAAAADASLMTMELTAGAVRSDCVPPETVPTNVTASTNRTDGVLIQWTPIGLDGAQYRVWCGATPDSSSAHPLDMPWTAQTQYLDTTAPAAVETSPAGCFQRAEYSTVTRYYWVSVRTPDTLCEGGLSAAPAAGFRSGAKAALAASATPLQAGFAFQGRLEDTFVLSFTAVALFLLGRRKRSWLRTICGDIRIIDIHGSNRLGKRKDLP